MFLSNNFVIKMMKQKEPCLFCEEKQGSFKDYYSTNPVRSILSTKCLWKIRNSNSGGKITKKLAAIVIAPASCDEICCVSIKLVITLSNCNVSLASGNKFESERNICGKYVSFHVHTNENKNTTKIAGFANGSITFK